MTYVVTATFAKAKRDPNGNRERHDLAAFDKRADAERHAERLHSAWIERRVEKRG